MAEGPAFRKYCRICWYGGRCWRFALSGSFNFALNWGGILGVAALGFLLQRGFGVAVVNPETWQGVAFQAAMYVVVAWVLIFAIRLLIAPFMIHREGQWRGTKFIYKEPKLAFHVYVSPEDNNKTHTFRFRDAPPYSFIEYEFKFDFGSAKNNLMSIDLGCKPVQLRKFSSHQDLFYLGGGITTNRERDMCLTTFLMDTADPFSVRVYVKSWDEPKPKDDYKREEDFSIDLGSIGPAKWG